MTCWSSWHQSGQGRDNNELSQLECGEEDIMTKAGQVILVSVTDFLDERVQPEALEEPGDLWSGPVGQETAQGAVLESADLPFPSGQGEEESQVVRVEEVEAPIRPVVFSHPRA